MTCERYWREGIALVEREQADPHRVSCADCRRAHAARHELVHALPMIGGLDSGDPQWQVRVWRQIARERSMRTMWRCATGALVAACATTLFWLMVGHSSGDGADHPAATAIASHEPVRPSQTVAADAPASTITVADSLPWIEIISGPVAMRSATAHVGDRVRISARSGDEIRVYRAEKLMLQCNAATTSAVCLRSAGGLVAETALASAGDYQLVVIKAGAVASVGSLATDLAAIVKAGGDYQLNDLSIR